MEGEMSYARVGKSSRGGVQRRECPITIMDTLLASLYKNAYALWTQCVFQKQAYMVHTLAYNIKSTMKT
jgi:hypothetical protein